MQEARSLLADLLVQLEQRTHDRELRLKVASTANRLALAHGDPSLADVAEALVADLDGSTIDPQLKEQQVLARAARRAIALAHRQASTTPRDLAKSLAHEPSDVVMEVETLFGAGKVHLARAVLEVGLARHPSDSILNRLRGKLEPSRPVWDGAEGTGESAAQA